MLRREVSSLSETIENPLRGMGRFDPSMEEGFDFVLTKP